MMFKIRYTSILMVFLTVLLMTSQSSSAAVDAGVYEGNSYNYTMAESVELQSVDKSVKADAKTSIDISYEFTDNSVEDDENDVAHILAIRETDFDGKGFDWDYEDDYFELEEWEFYKSSTTSTTNRTIFDGFPSAFLSIDTDPTDKGDFADFVIGVNPITFTFDGENITEGFEENIDDYLDDVASGDFDAELELDGATLEYSVEGTVNDTYGFVDQDDDDDELGVAGGFTLEYDNDGALKSYSLEYTFTFDGVDIVIFSYSFGSGGFLSNAGGLPGFGFYLAMTSLLLIPVLRRFKAQ